MTNSEFEIDITEIRATSRKEYREILMRKFLEEEPGSLIEVKYYYYTVERLSDDNFIYLKRPTALNKGVDFEVRVSNVQFRLGKSGNKISTGNRPSHKDIFNDLVAKKNDNKQEFDKLKPLIAKIYACQEVTLDEIKTFHFSQGVSLEVILYVLKWLFIEQDITYWNRSGRQMLYDYISTLWNK